MDTLQIIALIVIALIILAVIIVFRESIALTLEAWGIRLGLKAKNRTARPLSKPTPPAPAGVRVEGFESGGDILIEEGRVHDPTGTGIEAKDLKAKGGILIGKGESGGPKASPPA